MIKLAIHGASGRMGRAIARLAVESGEFQLVGAAAHISDPNIGKDIGELAGVGHLGVELSPDVGAALLGADVAIDFSLAPAVAHFARLAAEAGVPFVSGTTNLDAEAELALDEAAKLVPVLWARNMSLGVQILAELVTEAVRRLGPGFDVEITEVHHRKKIDAPSGTAMRLFDAVKEARSEVKPVFGREGITGARTDEEVGIFGIRGGDIPGDHTVFLFGNGERIELTHRATNRDLFAQGALTAAQFLIGKAPGRYDIPDVLKAQPR